MKRRGEARRDVRKAGEMIHFECEHCRGPVCVDAKDGGKRGRCPHCKQVAEFSGRLTKKQLGWLDGIVAIIRDYETELAPSQVPADIAHSDIFELLQVVDVVVRGNAEEIEAQAVSTFLSCVPNAPAFAALRDLAADKARTRGSWDYEGLRAVLAERGVKPGVLRGPEDEGHDEDEAEREALEQELKVHRRNLRTLRQQAAVYGAGAEPLHLLNQIEHEGAMIRDIERQLTESGGGR